MAIEFHCPYCGKQIRASDEHAGRHGKCPACHQSVYIPTPTEQIEPLELEPVDEEFEARKARLLDESKKLQQRLLHERDVPAEPGGRRGAAGAAGAGGHAARSETPLPPPQDLEELIIQYALHMKDGRLDRAEELAVEIRRHIAKAEPIIDRLVMDEIPPPQLAGIPRPVLNGLLKQLRER